MQVSKTVIKLVSPNPFNRNGQPIFPTPRKRHNQNIHHMYAKIKPSIFIDALQLELTSLKGNLLKGVLRDDKGSVCSVLEKDGCKEDERFTWNGLNDLSYGKYTLELSQGSDELTMNLVKRI